MRSGGSLPCAAEIRGLFNRVKKEIEHDSPRRGELCSGLGKSVFSRHHLSTSSEPSLQPWVIYRRLNFE
jgi:hypothetical protein